MKKQDWIDIVSLQLEQTWNWTDWTLFLVSVISPIIMLCSVIFAWRATKISKEATEINLEMYKRQIEDFEKSFLPVFEVQTLQALDDIIIVNLINKNQNSISVTNIATEYPISATNITTQGHLYSYEEIQRNDSDIQIEFLGEFKDEGAIKMYLKYVTLNHKHYTSKITFRIIEESIVMQDHNIIEDI